MAKHFVISLIVAVVLAQCADSRPAYQILEDRPGYVGVYIRLGDQPLDEINFALAEAFREHDISARNIKSEIESSPESPEPSFDLTPMLPLKKEAEGSTILLPVVTPVIPEEVKIEESKPVEATPKVNVEVSKPLEASPIEIKAEASKPIDESKIKTE